MIHCRRRTGFTMVEILMVVMIIGLLAAIAIPTMVRMRQKSQVIRFIRDIGVASAAFEMYRLEHKEYPPDTMAGVVPEGMAPYLQGIRWTQETAIGGLWGWDVGRFGFRASIAVLVGGSARDEVWREVDRRMDDGDLESGRFRRRSNGFTYVVEY